MKATILSILVFCIAYLDLSAQDIEISTEKSNEINDFANSITEIKEFGSDYIAVKIIVAGREIGGHPELKGKDIVLYDLYLRIQERIKDYQTINGSFWVDGDFHNPRNFEFDPETKTLIFQEGTNENPKKIALILTATGIKIK